MRVYSVGRGGCLVFPELVRFFFLGSKRHFCWFKVAFFTDSTMVNHHLGETVWNFFQASNRKMKENMPERFLRWDILLVVGKHWQ